MNFKKQRILVAFLISYFFLLLSHTWHSLKHVHLNWIRGTMPFHFPSWIVQATITDPRPCNKPQIKMDNRGSSDQGVHCREIKSGLMPRKMTTKSKVKHLQKFVFKALPAKPGLWFPVSHGPSSPGSLYGTPQWAAEAHQVVSARNKW